MDRLSYSGVVEPLGYSVDRSLVVGLVLRIVFDGIEDLLGLGNPVLELVGVVGLGAVGFDPVGAGLDLQYDVVAADLVGFLAVGVRADAATFE